MGAAPNSRVVTTPKALGKWISYFRGRAGASTAYPGPPVHHVAPALPPEVLAEIFLYCLPPGKWGSFSACDAPWVLTKVCHLWREIALSTPSLWSKLPMLEALVAPRIGDYHPQLLEFHLEKSTTKALSLAFELSPNQNDTPFLPFITPHLSRTRHLKIVYHHQLLGKKICIAHEHFPLLESLELICAYTDGIFWVPQGQLMTAQLEGIKFPWAQLTQLTIQVSSSTEALALFRSCTSLEVCHLRSVRRRETSPTPTEPMTIHPRLRTLIVEEGPFLKKLFGHLVTPDLSSLEVPSCNSQSILLFIKNSSAELTSLTLRGGQCPPQDLADLSALIPMVAELDLEGLCEQSLQLLAVKSNSPHGALFPCLKRLVIRRPHALESVLLNTLYSRIYLAPNTDIVGNMSPLQYAELHLPSSGRRNIPIFPGESYQDRPELRKLISQLQCVYSKTVRLDKKNTRTNGELYPLSPGSPLIFLEAKVVQFINPYVGIFPRREGLGYRKVMPARASLSLPGHFPPLPQQHFFQKLDAAFAALEGHSFTHAMEILANRVDELMCGFSRVPETAFLHHPTYRFHIRAARLLEQWQPMISEYKAKDGWVLEYDHTMDQYASSADMFKLVYRRPMRA